MGKRLENSIHETVSYTHLLSSEKDLTVPSLPNLSDDVKLLQPELQSASPQDHSFSTTIVLEFLRISRRARRQSPSSGIGVESGSAFFPRCNVSKCLEIVVQEIWDHISQRQQLIMFPATYTVGPQWLYV